MIIDLTDQIKHDQALHRLTRSFPNRRDVIYHIKSQIAKTEGAGWNRSDSAREEYELLKDLLKTVQEKTPKEWEDWLKFVGCSEPNDPKTITSKHKIFMFSWNKGFFPRIAISMPPAGAIFTFLVMLFLLSIGAILILGSLS